MHSGAIYLVLVRLLDQWRAKPASELVKFVDAPVHSEQIQFEGQSVTVELRVQWADAKQVRLVVEATALGPSTWATERVSERCFVEVGQR